MKKLMIDTIEKAFLSEDRHVARAAFYACKNYRYDADHFDKWIQKDNLNYKIGACFLIRSSDYAPIKHVRAIITDPRFSNYDVAIGKELLLRGFNSKTIVTNTFPPDLYSKYYSPALLKKAVTRIPSSGYAIKKWLTSDKWYEKCMALYSVEMLGGYHFLDFVDLINDIDKDVKNATIEALRSLKLSPTVLISRYNGATDISERISWMKVAAFREDLMLPFVPNEMDISEIRELSGLRVDDKVRNEWLKGTEKERTAALYSLVDEPNPPYVVINRALREESPMAHEVALIVAGKHGYPAHRDFEPAETVFKKCIGNVIIKARIPMEAQVRGDARADARSNMAIITDVLGDFFGEPVGISFYNATTQYRKGDFVMIEDFDYSFNDCSTGFHFFSDYNLARKFYY